MQHEAIVRQIDDALQTASAERSLHALAGQLKAQGVTQEEMYQAFKSQLARYRDTSELSADLLADVADRIVGWCAPELRLFDTELER